jgi:GxxExxY protein
MKTFSDINKLTEKVIGLAIKVHKTLGPGFLESVYRDALAYELKKAGIPFEKEKAMPVKYEEIYLDTGFRTDLFVDEQLIVETKAISKLNRIDVAQTINYLKISNLQIGLLINFNVILLKDGLMRIANEYYV